MHSIIFELRPRLQVCNVFIVVENNLNMQDTVKISIKQKSIDLEWTCDGTPVKVQLMGLNVIDCKILPHTLSALQVQGNSITFRIQTEPLTYFSGSFATEVLAYKQPTYSPSLTVPHVRVNEPCSFACRCCGNVLSKNGVTFERVLPLPSASWETADFFCHRHSTCSEPRKALGHVKDTDCLYGPCFISIPLSALRACSTKEGITRCDRCLSWLGTCLQNRIKLWNCSVVYGMLDPCKTPLEDFIFVVKGAIQESVGMLCRLILETRISEKDKHYLLLWVMDKDLQLLTDLNRVQHTQAVPVVSGVFIKSELKSVQSIKVLYLYQSDCTSTVKMWQNDVNVQTIDISKQMFTEGLQHLVNVTQLIPTPSQKANNFFVAYVGIL